VRTINASPKRRHITSKRIDRDLVQVFNEFSTIPFESASKTDSLGRIVELGQKALRSRACMLVFVDLDNQRLTYAAVSAFDKEFEQRTVSLKVDLGSAGKESFLSFRQASSGEPFEAYQLDVNGKGVANPEIAQRYGLRSLLAYPLKIRGQFIGYLVHLGSDATPFSEWEKHLLEMLAHQAALTIDHHDQNDAFVRSVALLSELSASILRVSPQDFVDRVAASACELLRADDCVVWRLQRLDAKLRVLSAHPILDEELRKLELDPMRESVSHLAAGRVGWLSAVQRSSSLYEHAGLAVRRGWVSLLSAPMCSGERLIGMIDVYTRESRRFQDWERKLFKTFADQTAVALERAEPVIRGWHSYAALQTSDGAELQEILGLVAEQCAGLPLASRCVVRLRNDLTGQLDARALFDAAKGILPVADVPAVGAEQVAGQVARLGVSYIAEDITSSATGEEILAARSLLCVPIQDRFGVVGTVSVGSPKLAAFNHEDQTLVEGLVSEVPRLLESAASRDSMAAWARLMSGEQPVDQFLEGIVQKVRVLTRAPLCFVWLMDRARNGFVLSRANEGFIIPLAQGKPFVSRDDPKVAEVLSSCQAVVRVLGGRPDRDPFAEAVSGRDWGSTALVPLVLNGQEFGVLQVSYVDHGSRFEQQDRRALEAVAVPATVGIRNRGRREKRFVLAEAVQEMARTETEEDLLKLLCHKACQLTDTQRGIIATLESELGPVVFRYHTHDSAPIPLRLPERKGITFQGMREKTSKMVDDVSLPAYVDSYFPLWHDTASELAVPLTVVTKVWCGEELGTVSEALGAINVESPARKAFSRFDMETLESLAAPAALILQRLQTERKSKALRDAEKELVGKRSEAEIIDVVARAIASTLEFDHLNISFVDVLSKRIRSKYVFGGHISEAGRPEFIRMADYSLKDKDIQPWVVQNRRIVVPQEKDPRFNGAVHARFRLHELVRVYVPMIVSIDGRVLGTVEGGYLRSRRAQISDRDVQILKHFVDYATSALDQSRKLEVTKILHEITAPLAAIQNSASYLQDHWRRLSQDKHDKVDRKLADILLDCVLGLTQVGHLWHLFGRRPPRSMPRQTFVMRDVVFKVLYQFVPEFRARGIDFVLQVGYNRNDSKRIRIWVDPALLTQVLTNLVSNAIKYCTEPKNFWLTVDVFEHDEEYFLIRISDNGIGIAPDLEERIFDDGFRAPEAQKLNVTGSGVGLTIARNLMRGIGGDLRLAHPRIPTAFDIVIPRTLEHGPK
jgi:GAF domain-containing protein/anti-sigma regulatory factor (Ser/Thr protein kinase)